MKCTNQMIGFVFNCTDAWNAIIQLNKSMNRLRFKLRLQQAINMNHSPKFRK